MKERQHYIMFCSPYHLGCQTSLAEYPRRALKPSPAERLSVPTPRGICRIMRSGCHRRILPCLCPAQRMSMATVSACCLVGWSTRKPPLSYQHTWGCLTWPESCALSWPESSSSRVAWKGSGRGSDGLPTPPSASLPGAPICSRQQS